MYSLFLSNKSGTTKFSSYDSFVEASDALNHLLNYHYLSEDTECFVESDWIKEELNEEEEEEMYMQYQASMYAY